jgi:dolichyl-phosphate-mannose--protein O-mannosyl transferase
VSDYANQLIIAGHTQNIFAPCSSGGLGEYVVQPEMGKLLIAVGEWMFGLNSFGWRFSSALFGSLAILLMCRIARRMTRSTLLGCIAGLLMALDGLEFVLSRTGILDIFLMFFVLAAFGCMVVDRDVSRARLAEAIARFPGGDMRGIQGSGPRLGMRKWRVAAGVFLGLAVATKWNAVWYILALAMLGIAWDMGARRSAGVRSFVRGGLREAVWLPLTFIVLPLAVYLATWSGWFATGTGYYRDYAQQHGVHIPVISPLYSLWAYHLQAVKFGLGLSQTHPYMSQPWDWLVITRPVAFFYESYTGPVAGPSHFCPSTGCTGPSWSQEVLAIGTPAIWWASILALGFCLGWWLLHRDWRAGAVLLGVLAGWGPWFPLVSRTKFYYYALEFEPFLILSIVLCLGLLLGPAAAGVIRRSVGALVVGAYVLAVLLMFWYFYSILAARVIPYHDWYSHMWYRIGRGWI